MMPSKNEPDNDNREEVSSRQLLCDIEEISRALYLHKTPPKDLLSPLGHQSKSLDIAPVTRPKANVILKKLLYREKKSSKWNWNPLKALTHIGNRRFNCCFFLYVHSIEGLPSSFNDLSLCVYWKKMDEVLRTRAARVCQGMVGFEETLMHRCSVYGNKNGPQNSVKYEPQHFLLNASVVGAPKLDIGKHWVDLTRLLPLTLEKLEQEQMTSGKWTTSFKLTGKAKGAVMNVSFGFSLWGKSTGPYYFVENPENLRGNEQTPLDNLKLDHGWISTTGMLPRLNCVPRDSSTLSHVQTRSMDIRKIDENFPKMGSEFAHSISFLYRKLGEEKLGSSDEIDFSCGHVEPLKPKSACVPRLTGESNVHCNTEFTVHKHEREMPLKEQIKVEEDAKPNDDHSVVETIDIAEIFKDIETSSNVNTEFRSKLKIHDDNTDRSLIEDNRYGGNNMCCNKSTTEEPESDFYDSLTSGSVVLGASLDTSKFARQECNVKRTLSSRKGMVRSLSLDDLTESVANDFLNMLGITQCLQRETFDNGPESPRERLLQQFEEESLALGNSIFDFKTTEQEQIEFGDVAATSHGRVGCSDDFYLLLADQEAEKLGMETDSSRSKKNEKLLDNLGTEPLTEARVLGEKDFHHSPCTSPGGFGSPIHLHSK